jgi:TPR repeat protein
VEIQPRQLALALLAIVLLKAAGAQTVAGDSTGATRAVPANVPAQTQLGTSLAAVNGSAVGQTTEGYRAAALQGNPGAQVHMAEAYRDGRGVPRDMAQAAEWYRKAAEQGDAGAQGALGVLYSMGLGVSRSDVEAYYWLDLAARASGPNQQRYAQNRQNVGARITADELAQVQERVTRWLAIHGL